MAIKNRNEIRKLGTILGVWAHPDDEIFSMAGIMAVANRNGQNVIMVIATRGEAGVQDENRWPANKLADIRTKELEEVYKILGVSKHYWLDYRDGKCSQVEVKEASSRIAEIISTYNPYTIMTFGPDGITGHDDHKTVSGWANEANKIAGNKAKIYHAIHTLEQYSAMIEADKDLNIYFNIDKPNVCEDCDCDICFKLTDEICELKLKALAVMPSQTEKLLKKYKDILKPAFCTEAFIGKK